MYIDKNLNHRGELLWTTYQGISIPISKIEDMHLANIIKWIEESPKHYSASTLIQFNKEAKKRNLTEDFLERAPYPHRNIDGKWIQFINGRPTIVGR